MTTPYEPIDPAELLDRVVTVHRHLAEGLTPLEISERTGYPHGWVSDVAVHDVYGPTLISTTEEEAAE